MPDVLSNLGSVFFSPREVAIRISEKPHWLLPLIIVVVVNFLMIYIVYPLQMELVKESMVSNLRSRGLDDEAIEIYLKVTPARRMIAASMGGILGTVVMVLIASAVLNLLSPLIGAKIGFTRMFAYFCYPYWIISVGGVIRGVLMLVKKTYDIRTSLAAFAPSVGLSSSLGALLSSFDLFTIWAICALGIGYAELAKTTRRKSFGLVLTLWAAAIAISVFFARIRMQ